LESGQEMARRVLAMNIRPTAIFAANNFIALGVLKIFSLEGVRVPEDISVVGFDDLPASMLIDPILTVAAQPAYEMGVQATKMLLQRLVDRGEGRPPQEVVLPVEIVERKSVLAR
jgi:DNA-binding LacI/PurR family transcriptional regulator